MKKYLITLCLLFSHLAFATPDFSGEDGYNLWLNYRPLNARQQQHYLSQLGTVYIADKSATTSVIKDELKRATKGLLGQKLSAVSSAQSAKLVLALNNNQLTTPLGIEQKSLGDEGYAIKQHKGQIWLVANSDVGLLYATFDLIRQIQTLADLSKINKVSVPKVKLRMLNHWDDLDRHTERGYAGQSIFDWHKLPDYQEQRYYDYARANASIGVNGIVPNNVNANALILTPAYLQKVKALADIFRPYGIKVYLSVKFSSPHLIGGLENSDPVKPEVQQWWHDKAAEIYQLIPDFGGFLVKANSEGQPGPGDFGRTHAQGANMLARALKPFGGNVLWRAFVYAHDAKAERSLQAYNEFVPLDGKFDDNVSVQVKNGPIDFQPREPFSPLFGAMPHSSLAMEFQITQEYLGFSTHLAYLGTLYKEALDADTHTQGAGSTVAKVVDGSLSDSPLTAMAGVANIGMDRNWTGHIFGQANWYVFGRLAWDHDLSAADIADEWINMTLTHDKNAIDQIKDMMMNSREDVVNYMTPLGLHHLMDTGHHYGPGPWVDNLGRADWNPTYYHRADKQGLGIDRTASGTNAISQYAPYWQQKLANPATTPTELLLWFHHLSWDYTMPSGKSLWYELVHHYNMGVAGVEKMQQQWQRVKNQIDPNQFHQVEMALGIQLKEAKWWRDACLAYFQTFSQRPIPEGFPKPVHDVDYYKSLQFPYAPGQG
ncbi:alpha-glucuronidase family glycosyl hydrolase [Neptunicella marina]|uniref:Xylan alpha-1,2-glucuronidase n=1 Tax=Neptunicella marina TaxID=2125989 RepID=A0A8J6M4C1_9ALTE|nr:alpha-glucuronidase family glycosyl hydrolase [Neptunicella marina]MBC3765981.1 alpha-glucuronidase [Neptunicella marina]